MAKKTMNKQLNRDLKFKVNEMRYAEFLIALREYKELINSTTMDGLVNNINRESYIVHLLAKKSSIGTNTIEKVIVGESEIDNELVAKSAENGNSSKVQTVLNFLLDYEVKDLINFDDLVKEVSRLHATIFRGMKEKKPGKFKTVENFIPDTKVFIDPKLVIEELSKLQGFISNSSFSDIAIAAIAHAKFIEIHPFSNGNGRIGRLLSNKLLEKLYGVPLWIDEAMSKTLVQYVSALDNFHFNGEATDIVNYFIEMSIQQMNRNTQLINESYTLANSLINAVGITLDQAIYIVTYKSVSMAKFSKEFNIHRNTAKNILDKLVDSGYMNVNEVTKGKIYRIK